MAITEDNIELKPAILATRCERQLDQAIKYLEDNYAPEQAAKMRSKFFKIVKLLELFPELGTKYRNGMRKFLLGKFRYNIYYRETKANVEIIGIQHTSQGAEFED